MKSDAALTATPSQTVGPFLHVGLPRAASGSAIDGFPESERIRLRVSVTDGDSQPVSDALVELWHTSPAEAQALPDGSARTAVARFARMPTDEAGACEFETLRPGSAPGDDGAGLQAAHINVCLFARGLLRQLHTRIYFAGDPALAEDAVLALVPEGRRGTLIARPDGEDSRRWVFDVRLQGPQETVFFDV